MKIDFLYVSISFSFLTFLGAWCIYRIHDMEDEVQTLRTRLVQQDARIDNLLAIVKHGSKISKQLQKDLEKQ